MPSARQRFLLTRPSRGATSPALKTLQIPRISTHTPLAGRDIKPQSHPGLKPYFYSHAPRGARHGSGCHCSVYGNFYSHAPRGARQYSQEIRCGGWPFLLTRPSRGATQGSQYIRLGLYDFYSHAPRGARRGKACMKDRLSQISTHTPLAGRDVLRPAKMQPAKISTHTPLAGRDGIPKNI